MPMPFMPSHLLPCEMQQSSGGWYAFVLYVCSTPFKSSHGVMVSRSHFSCLQTLDCECFRVEDIQST